MQRVRGKYGRAAGVPTPQAGRYIEVSSVGDTATEMNSL
jgi:hypothetical protein